MSGVWTELLRVADRQKVNILKTMRLEQKLRSCELLGYRTVENRQDNYTTFVFALPGGKTLLFRWKYYHIR